MCMLYICMYGMNDIQQNKLDGWMDGWMDAWSDCKLWWQINDNDDNVDDDDEQLHDFVVKSVWLAGWLDGWMDGWMAACTQMK